ncbi:SDR family NAD(P)-dependent oxidoreductase [Actinoplanes friuliensis]|uniref:Short chain dehydrogenase n=1 Tax=Actinoplanes friuliensis DSM 7358 TaxID=1246995 RepID=U5VV94_9ACTN|nr:short chain dehydrogenase [Actinoplanes friuliensis DSM 7358]
MPGNTGQHRTPGQAPRARPPRQASLDDRGLASPPGPPRGRRRRLGGRQLLGNAGIGYFAAVEESDDVAVRAMLEINMYGLAAVTNAVLPGMRARRSGTILNLSSIVGIRSFPSLGWYSASKFAVEGLSEALAQEVAPLGIKVVIVGAGHVRHRLGRQLRRRGRAGQGHRRLRPDRWRPAPVAAGQRRYRAGDAS